MKKQFGSSAVELLLWFVVILGFGGWIANLVKIAMTFSDALTGLFILRCLGVFVAPVGAVLGFF